MKVTNIALATEFVRQFSTGCFSERWAKKRPRLKSSKLKQESTNSHSDTNYDDRDNDDDNFDVSMLLDELIHDDDTTPGEMIEEDQVDPDIERLLAETCETDVNQLKEDELEEEEADKEMMKQRKKAKRKEKRKKSKNSRSKTVKLSLSKPQSPETTQIIRVNVTSNYSIDEFDKECKIDAALLAENNCVADGFGDELGVPDGAAAASGKDGFNFEVDGLKVELTPRK